MFKATNKIFPANITQDYIFSSSPYISTRQKQKKLLQIPHY